MIDSEKLEVFYQAHCKDPTFLNEVDPGETLEPFEDHILDWDMGCGVEKKERFKGEGRRGRETKGKVLSSTYEGQLWVTEG